MPTKLGSTPYAEWLSSQLRGRVSEQLRKEGVQIQPEFLYEVTTLENVANEQLEESFGDAILVSVGTPLRDQLITYASKNGFG